jgi:EF-P beta-lysylation protein EpmB
MINSAKTSPWQQALINAVTQPKELLERLELDQSLLEAANKAAALFPLKVTNSFINRMRKKDLNDPLLRQVLPLGEELNDDSKYSIDPLQEAKVNPIPGLLHKYHGRVLLIYTGSCGINCRFCFRREFPYVENSPGTLGWNKALEYIAHDQSISEVILSGGDPLIANDVVLKSFVLKLEAIPHVKRLRLHSRMPIVLPERITPEFIEWMTMTRLKTILVVHCNHPQEINSEVKAAMQLLVKASIPLLNQSVLLKDINDKVETLAELSEALFDCGILPYYLHILDKVKGTGHFDLEIIKSKEIVKQLSYRLSGFLVPKLVYEQPGYPAKSFIG